MLSVRDNGGGMDRAAMHRMMSFGESAEGGKRIDRYGNGFKSSAMRLGSDALVLSCNKATGGLCAGLLSYSFLRAEQMEDVMVPLVAWDANGRAVAAADRAAAERRARAMQILLEWGPGFTEGKLLGELRKLRPHGTQVRGQRWDHPTIPFHPMAPRILTWHCDDVAL